MTTPLIFRQQLAYALPAAALALMGVTFYVFLPRFYSDVIGVPLGLLGGIVLVSRLFDALIDPLLGILSDRTQTRWGRRIPWMAVASPLAALSFLCLLSPPPEMPLTANIVWLTFWTFVFFLFWSMVTVPYEALGAELSDDYDERTRILALRDGLLILGTLLSGLFPVLFDLMWGQDIRNAASERYRLEFLGLFYAFLLVVLVLICVGRIRERHWREDQRPPRMKWREFYSLLENRPFAILLSAYTIMAFGGELPATLLLFFVKYVLGSDQDSLYLVLYFGIGFVLLPFWVRLASRLGKKETWLLALAINTGAFSGVLFLDQGNTSLFTILVCLSAVGYGATLAIPSSMQADVIDYEEWRTGVRKEGELVGIWLVARKLARALGAGIALPLLSLSGYQPNTAQSPTTLWTLTFLYAGVPCLCNFTAMLVAWRYPIDRQFHQKIRREIERPGQGESDT